MWTLKELIQIIIAGIIYTNIIIIACTAIIGLYIQKKMK